MKQRKIGLGIAFGVALGVAAPALAQQAVQWRVEDGGNGHWYQIATTFPPTQFAQKLAIATGRGGSLASIGSQAENEFIFNLVSASGLAGGRVCIGGKRCGNCAWQWTDGTPWQFTAWGPNEPGNPGDVHVELMITSGYPGLWADVWDYDGSENRYAIEWSADCNADGIVDYGQILDGTLEDTNSNGVPDCCDAGQSCIPCPGDITGGGVVDGIDLAAVLGAWGTSGQGKFNADVNDDGTVDASDLSIVLAGWGPCPN